MDHIKKSLDIRVVNGQIRPCLLEQGEERSPRLAGNKASCHIIFHLLR